MNVAKAWTENFKTIQQLEAANGPDLMRFNNAEALMDAPFVQGRNEGVEWKLCYDFENLLYRIGNIKQINTKY